MIDPDLVTWVERECGIALVAAGARPVSGGCIHQAWLVDTRDGGLVFVKCNDADRLSMFEAERKGLELLAASATVRVPAPLAHGIAGGRAVLAMEGFELRGGGPGSAARLADRLADLHETASPSGRFGADFDNFIGATPQRNGWGESWADFFVERRLAPQFRLAAARGRHFSDAERLMEAVRAHLARLEVRPSLLHGDLWGGNAAFLPDGEPVVFDPAVYFGDREADLAFTRLFGGFGPAFYERYRSRCPEPEPVRETIYNLYHLLNHFHLFGGGYAEQAEGSIRSILREIG